MKKLLTIIFLCSFYAGSANADTLGIKLTDRSFNMQAKLKTSALHKKYLLMKSVDKHHVLGKFNPKKDTAFIEASLNYANRNGLYVRREVYDVFKKMHAAAKADGISLTIVSATRNFYYQKGIWERKWNGHRIVEGKNLAKEISDPVERARIILRYSSMPGTSRHHWGTDLDFNSVNNSYFETAMGKKFMNG